MELDIEKNTQIESTKLEVQALKLDLDSEKKSSKDHSNETRKTQEGHMQMLTKMETAHKKQLDALNEELELYRSRHRTNGRYV